MKHLYILLCVLTFIVFIHVAYGQCENNVSTNYNQTPTNNALPTNSPNPAYGQKFLNEFDWVPRSVNQTVEKYQTINMNSNILDAGEIQNIYSNQQNPYYSYLYNDLEPNPQNGWELISVNLGYFPNGEVQLPSSDYTDFPYLILYNKYRSILRVFGVLGTGYADFGALSIDGVVVKLFIEDFDINTNKNGLLRRAEGTDKTLDQETEFYKMASVTKHQNQKGKWFSADFQIAYDPCVCFYDSRLRLKFDFIEKAYSFDAQINSISIEEDLIENNSGLADVDFLNNFNYTSTGTEGEYDASNGYLIYEAIDNLLENYEKELTVYEDSLAAIGEHNKQVTKRKWIVKAGKYVLKAGTLALTGGGSAALELQQVLPIIAPELMKTVNELSEDIIPKLQEVLGQGSKMLISQWVGEKISPKDYPDQPMHPTATFTQSTMRGTIQRTVDNYAGPLLRTPGSYTSSSSPITTPHEYPVYNEALGVFALLKKPTIKTYSSTEDDVCTYETEEVEPGVWMTSRNLEYTSNTQWKIDEKLIYVINPVLNVKNVEVLAAIEISGFNTLQEVDPLNLQKSDSADNKLLVNAESISMEFQDNSNHTQKLVDSITAISKYYPIDALQNITSQMSYRVKRNVPPTAVSNPNDFYFCQDFLKEFEVTGARLKLIVNITFEGEKSNGSPHDYTYMYTYKLDPNDIDDSFTSPLYPNLPNSQGDISQYPENLYLNGETFDGSLVDGCQLNENTYLCKAWNDITLTGNFTVSNDYNVIVEAGNEVLVKPETNTPPEMVWQIAPVLNYNDPMPPVDRDYVKSFCENENQYKARFLSIPTINSESNFESEEESRDIFAFNIYPNPTNGNVAVNISLNEEVNGQLYITDMNGRVLKTAFDNQILRAGDSRHQLATESLSKGIYLVHLIVDGERHVKRLVKQ